MFSIKKYLNFNSSTETVVKTFAINENLAAGICKYNGNNRSIFLIEEPTFTCVVTGNKYMIINNKEFFLTAGDILYIPQNSIVFTYIPKQETYFESINVKLSKTFLNENLVLFSDAVLKPKNTTIEKTIIRLKQLLIDQSLAGPEKQAACVNCITALFFQFDATLSSENVLKKLRYEDLERIKKVLLETIFKSTSVSEIAKQCNMSISTFKRKFETAFGIPPKTWKRNICLQAAYFNLRTGNYKISDIIDNTGFESFSHFSYAFKKQFNFSPSYIAQNKLN